MALIFGLALSTPAISQTIPADVAGCITRDTYNEFTTAAVNNDLRHIQALLDSNVCFNIGGREFSVVDRNFSISRARIYAGGSSMILYVPTSAIR